MKNKHTRLIFTSKFVPERHEFDLQQQTEPLLYETNVKCALEWRIR